MSSTLLPCPETFRAAESRFSSLLYEDGDECPATEVPAYFRDLNLDQVVATITAGRSEYRLDAFFHQLLPTVAAVQYRHEVMRDLSGSALSECLRRFAAAMRTVRERLALAEKLYGALQRQRWFLHAAETYCAAVRALAAELAALPVSSRGLASFRAWLAEYVASDGFDALSGFCGQVVARLGAIDYAVLIRGGEFHVQRFAAEAD